MAERRAEVLFADVVKVIPTLAGNVPGFVDAVAVDHDAVVIKPGALIFNLR